MDCHSTQGKRAKILTNMMNEYIDIHCHVLPGIDDGARDMDMALKMIEMSYEQGVRCMIATPHYYIGHRNCTAAEVEEAYRAVTDEVSRRYRDFRLYLGNEIYYKKECVNLLKSGTVRTLAGSRYVLLEFGTDIAYRELLDAVRTLVHAGYYPVIAHMERYACLYKQEKQIRELIKSGAYMQVNGENFRKGLFVGERKYCRELIEMGLIHFLASDCHNLTERSPNLARAYMYLNEKLGEHATRKFAQNTELILQNQCISAN